jgi:MSHA biogenesis protein MshM
MRTISKEKRRVRPSVANEKTTVDWKLYWGFDRAPFAEHDSAYVSLHWHDDAIARLIHSIENADRRVFLTADAGLGKSAVLRRVLAMARNPRRRCVLVSSPSEGALLPGVLAERLAERVGRDPSPLACWRAIERAIRMASIQGIQVVIGIDDCETARAPVRRDIESLASLGTGSSAQLTVIQAGRPRQASRVEHVRTWAPAIGLESLTRAEAEHYLATKLAGAGRNAPVFTPRAVTRLHCLSAGVPRGIEQLATRCLMAGAAGGLELIPPELADTVEAMGKP